MEEVEKRSGQGSDDLTPRPPKARRDPRHLQSGVGLGIVVLLAAGVIWAGLNFREGGKSTATPAVAGAEVTDGVVIVAEVEAIDPVADEMTIRLAPVPFGSYGNTSFAKPVTILTTTSHGLITTDIKDGSPITSFLVTIPLEDSQVTDYPFDSYKSPLVVKIGVPGDGTGNRALPTQLSVDAAQHGYKIAVSPELRQTSNDTGQWIVATATFHVRRSASIRFFAGFLMVLMWAISIALLWVALSVLFRRHPLQIPLLSVFGVVLFSLPALRAIQPNAPPLGALTDILAFFWCESLVAACFVTLIILFVRRGVEPPPVPARAQPEAPGS